MTAQVPQIDSRMRSPYRTIKERIISMFYNDNIPVSRRVSKIAHKCHVSTRYVHYVIKQIKVTPPPNKIYKFLHAYIPNDPDPIYNELIDQPQDEMNGYSWLFNR